MTKPGTRIALWAAAAVLVTAVASLAISASVGAHDAPLTAQDVARQLADDGSLGASPTSAPDPDSTAGPVDTVAPDVFSSPYGTVVATCDTGLATLQSWSPNPGYRVDDDVTRGPAAAASVRFESDTAPDVRITVSCTGGPVEGQVWARFAVEDDHGGGNSGPGGGGSDSGGGSGRDHPEDS